MLPVIVLICEIIIGLTNGIIFPLVDGNEILDCVAAWAQAALGETLCWVVLNSAKERADQQPYCALSDHISSRKI